MLTEPDDMDTYVLALAEDSLINAWEYQRTFPDKSETRSRLIKKVLEWCFTRMPPFFFAFPDPRGSIHHSKATVRTPQTIDLFPAFTLRTISPP